MDRKINQIFLASVILFSILIWSNVDEPDYYSSRVDKEYKDYMGQKIHKILESEKLKNLKLKMKSYPASLRMPASIAKKCRGCCLKHGGVVCKKELTICRDGSRINFECRSQGCNACNL